MKSFFPWFGALLISLSPVVSLMSYNRVDDEPISSVGTQIWRSLVYPNAFFHKTTKWNLVSLRILPCCEIWQKATQSFKSGAGWQGQTDTHTHTHPQAQCLPHLSLSQPGCWERTSARNSALSCPFSSGSKVRTMGFF